MIKDLISNKQIYTRFLRNENGFGLTEAIISISMLTFLISYSLYFISLRQATMYKANITLAINDEIRRDIEKLKIELWNEHYVKANQLKKQSAYYATGIRSNPNYFCDNIIRTFIRLPSWKNRVWIPGSNERTYSGQRRNKIFRGAPIQITRNVSTKRPFDIGSDLTVDRSLAEVSYSVKNKNEEIQWTSILLSSEAHSWCPPKGS